MDTLSIGAFLATTTLASIALSPSPNAPALVGLLVALQLYPRLFSKKSNKFVLPWAASTLGAVASHTGAASNALQGSFISTVVLAGISAVVSAIPVAVIYLDARFTKGHRYSWSQLAAFPAYWASTWGIIAMLTPVGRLVAWSPVTALGPYAWVSSYLGPWGLDFIVAAWSVVLTEVIATPLSQYILSIQDPDHPRNVEPIVPYTDNPDEPRANDHSPFWHKSAFALSLLALTVPSLWTSTIPNPTYTVTTTPFSLGCVLPQTLPHHPHHTPTVEDYIMETKKMTSAKLVLWPEGAVKFDNEAHRNETLEKIAAQVFKNRKGFHVGIGFEEDAPESWNKRASRRNGFALLVDNTTVLQYYKRHLVPIAESFSMVPSNEEPTLYELPLGPPSGTPKSEWAKGPDHTRPIPISSSICLDFASESAFMSLDSRPALILAPARTWHPSVGIAMWNQARQRAHETGSTILWCDGGEGGLSGVIGGGFEEPLQFGGGSWTKTIGLTYPFPERMTGFTFMRAGNFGAFLFIWIVAGGGGIVIQAAAAVSQNRRSIFTWNVVKAKRAAYRLTGLLHRNQPSDAEQGEAGRLIGNGGPGRREPALLDLDDDEQDQHSQQTPTYGATQRG